MEINKILIVKLILIDAKMLIFSKMNHALKLITYVKNASLDKA